MGCGNFDEDNQQELLRQKSRYLPAILRNKKLTDRQKLLAIITFDSPGSISLLNKVEQQYINQINEHNKEITSLKGTLSRLRAENEQFLDVVRSTKLLAGNIKRKLRARTKNSKIIK